MARAFNGTTQYLEKTTAVVSAYPLTLAGWVNPTTLPASTAHAILSMTDSSNPDNTIMLYVFGSNLVAGVIDGSGSVNAIGTTALSTSTWAHGTAVFVNATDRHILTNGGDKVTNTTSKNAPTVARTDLGATRTGASAATFFVDGLIAEVGIWSVALDDAEALALARGLSPTMIRPASLVAYWPLFGNDSPEPDRWKNRHDLTLVASPTKADHPRMFYPSHANKGQHIPAVGGARLSRLALLGAG